MNEEKQKIRPTIEALKKDEVATFPIERMRSVRALASEIGLLNQCRYITRTDKEKRVINVKRIE